MNKRELEVEKAKLKAEEQELKRLKAIYQKSSQDIAEKIAFHDAKIDSLKALDEMDDAQKSVLQAQIYQKNYQKSLQKQIDGFLKDLNSKQYKSINDYIENCYKDGFLGCMYDIAGQGIPIITPIDQKKVVKAMSVDSKISKNLYTKLGEDVDILKKRIANNISRGIAAGDSYANIARNISNASNVGFNRAMRIARTEGHRVQQQATADAQFAAKEKGADVVKQWDSTLDGKTRPNHRKLDGQLRELEEPFEVAGMKPMHPSDFGRPEEDINCRCTLLQRARWALDDDELETLKERAEYFGLDKTEDFDDFKKKYLKAAEEEAWKEELTNRRIERMAARKTAVENNKPVEKAERTLDDVNKDGRRKVWTHWDDYRGKFAGKGEIVPISELDTDELKGFYNTVKLEDIKVDVAEKVVETVDKLHSRFYSPLTDIKTMDKEKAFFANRTFATSYHQWSHGYATIELNQLKLKEDGIKRLKELAEQGYSIAFEGGREIEYVVTHEFAHTILNIGEKLPSKKHNFLEIDYTPVKKARKEIAELYDSYIHDLAKFEKDYDDLRKPIEAKLLFGTGEVTAAEQQAVAEAYKKVTETKISKYSLTNYEEFLAEGFTDVVMGKEPKEYSKKVYEVINKYFGK